MCPKLVNQVIPQEDVQKQTKSAKLDFSNTFEKQMRMERLLK